VKRRGPRAAAAGGAILLEVVLALALLVSAAAIVSAGMSTAMRSAGRMKRQAKAANLAVTLASRLRMGAVEEIDDGPQPYDDDEEQPIEDLIDWTWEVATESVENLPDWERVTVAIRHEPSGTTYRLVELMELEPVDEGEEAFDEDDAYGEGDPYDEALFE